MNKVEPMQRALDELDARGWIVGLRRSQATTRRHLDVLGPQDGYLKVHPIVDWKRVWPNMTAQWPDYDRYQAGTRRDIPVVLLSPR